eukprot:364500-Chlamydomonas_euryale.AAC.24
MDFTCHAQQQAEHPALQASKSCAYIEQVGLTCNRLNAVLSFVRVRSLAKPSSQSTARLARLHQAAARRRGRHTVHTALVVPFYTAMRQSAEVLLQQIFAGPGEDGKMGAHWKRDSNLTCPSGSPSGHFTASMAARRCRNPRNGATPVPGPTMMTGLLRSVGGLNTSALPRQAAFGSVGAQTVRQRDVHAAADARAGVHAVLVVGNAAVASDNIWAHEVQTWAHEAQTWAHEVQTWAHEVQTWAHEVKTWAHEAITAVASGNILIRWAITARQSLPGNHCQSSGNIVIRWAFTAWQSLPGNYCQAITARAAETY